MKVLVDIEPKGDYCDMYYNRCKFLREYAGFHCGLFNDENGADIDLAETIDGVLRCKECSLGEIKPIERIER